MHNAAALLDIHERGHRSLDGLLQHVRQLSAEEFVREIPGFGYPSVRQQLEHVIGAEEYWLNVVQGTYAGGEDERQCPTVDALEVYRKEVTDAAEEYLRHASEAELNAAREVTTWHGKRTLVPARVVLRTVAHIYQHQGQVMAMCRLMDKPGPAGLDFPLD